MQMEKRSPKNLIQLEKLQEDNLRPFYLEYYGKINIIPMTQNYIICDT